MALIALALSSEHLMDRLCQQTQSTTTTCQRAGHTHAQIAESEALKRRKSDGRQSSVLHRERIYTGWGEGGCVVWMNCIRGTDIDKPIICALCWLLSERAVFEAENVDSSITFRYLFRQKTVRCTMEFCFYRTMELLRLMMDKGYHITEFHCYSKPTHLIKPGRCR